MSQSEAPPSQGLVAGKYELVRLIGRGGMGSVWEARHVSLGTSSAIKFIESEYANSQEARSRFDKEAKAAATIQSKHAIQIFDHGVTDDGKPYIVMELLQGEPLDSMLDRGPIGLIETARILQQVCRGLARAHDRGIVHRDLKPENIFLVRTPDDEESIAKVLDFGIAKIQGGANSASGGLTSGTKTGAVLGTPFYMSPEQARGLRNVDHRADVWSLGVIAFKCVTGKLPFDGESVGDLLVKICTSPVPIPSQFAASLGIGGLPPSFDAWFLRALEREPDRRFPSVAQLADELCMIAGIHRGGGPASQYTPSTPHAPSHPSGSSPYVAGGPYGPGSGATPNGYGAPQATPHGYGAPQATPPPGAMTNAPFTREEIAAVPANKGKLVAASVVALTVGVLAVGGLLYKMREASAVRAEPTAAAAAISTTTSVSAPPPAPSHEPLPAASSNEPATAAVAKNADPAQTPPPSKPGKHTPPQKAPVPPAPPAKTSAAAPLPPPVPAPAPSPTQATPPAKKPNKNDPGY